MIIIFSDTTKFPIKDWVVWDYPMPSNDVGISYQQVKSGVEEKGWGIVEWRMLGDPGFDRALDEID